MFDPTTARFLSKDPLGEAGGSPNLYLYCANDPVNKIDPSGNRIITDGCPDQAAKAAERLWGYTHKFSEGSKYTWAPANQSPIKVTGFEALPEVSDRKIGVLDLFDAYPPDAWARFQKDKNPSGGGLAAWAYYLTTALDSDIHIFADPGSHNLIPSTRGAYVEGILERRAHLARGNAELERDKWKASLADAVLNPSFASVSNAVSQATGKAVSVGVGLANDVGKALNDLPSPLKVGLARAAKLAGVDFGELTAALEQFGLNGDVASNLLLRGGTIFENIAKGVQYGLEDFCGEDVFSTKGCKDVLSRMLDAVGEWVGIKDFGDLLKVVGKVLSGGGVTFKDAAGPVAKVFGLTWDRVVGLLFRGISAAAGGKDVSQAVLTVTGILEKMGPWLGVAEEGQAAKEPDLGGFIAEVIDKIDMFKQDLDAADVANLDLPGLFWGAFKEALLPPLLLKVAEFVASWVASLTPTPGSVIGWAKTAWDFYKAIRDRIEQLKAILGALQRIVTKVVTIAGGDEGALRSLGKDVSLVIQKNIPVAFSVLAAALKLGGIEQIPKKAIESVNMKIDDTVVKFVTALAKPVVKKLGGLFKGNGLDGLTLLTKPVKLKKYKNPERMGLLAKDKKGKVHLYLSGSDFKAQPDDAKVVKDNELIAAGDQLAAKLPDGKGPTGANAPKVLTEQSAIEKKIENAEVTSCATAPATPSSSGSSNSGAPAQKASDPCSKLPGYQCLIQCRLFDSSFKPNADGKEFLDLDSLGRAKGIRARLCSLNAQGGSRPDNPFIKGYLKNAGGFLIKAHLLPQNLGGPGDKSYEGRRNLATVCAATNRDLYVGIEKEVTELVFRANTLTESVKNFLPENAYMIVDYEVKLDYFGNDLLPYSITVNARTIDPDSFKPGAKELKCKPLHLNLTKLVTDPYKCPGVPPGAQPEN